MAREKKTRVIDEISEELKKSNMVVVTDYRGLPAKELTALRRQLAKNDGDYRVVKNTLAIFAAKKAGRDKLESLLTGPVALTYIYGDITTTVKALLDHIKTTGSALQVKGGMLGEKIIDRSTITALASLPPREVLLSQLLGAMKSPVQRFQFVISAPLRGLVTVLQGRARQLDEGIKTTAAG